jgi:hypothetical protein
MHVVSEGTCNSISLQWALTEASFVFQLWFSNHDIFQTYKKQSWQEIAAVKNNIQGYNKEFQADLIKPSFILYIFPIVQLLILFLLLWLSILLLFWYPFMKNTYIQVLSTLIFFNIASNFKTISIFVINNKQYFTYYIWVCSWPILMPNFTFLASINHYHIKLKNG